MFRLQVIVGGRTVPEAFGGEARVGGALATQNRSSREIFSVLCLSSYKYLYFTLDKDSAQSSDVSLPDCKGDIGDWFGEGQSGHDWVSGTPRIPFEWVVGCRDVVFTVVVHDSCSVA